MNLESEHIQQAIRSAEQNTSGEIMVIVTKKRSANVYEEAQKAFSKTGLGKTRAKNAVLIFIAEGSREFAILGDSGIHAHVGQDFWQELSTTLTRSFKENKFTSGLCEAISLCGEKLKIHFPRKTDDKNEVSDEVVIHH